MNKFLFFFISVILSFNTNSQTKNSESSKPLISQNTRKVLARDPDPRKDFANVFFNSKYTLFDFWNDQPIFPDNSGVYNIYYATNEDKTPRNFKGSAQQLEMLIAYKFQNKTTCENWTNGLLYNTTGSINSSSISSQNSSSQCLYKLSIPVIKWRIVDNRKLCIYCRSRYADYDKRSIEEQKKTNVCRLMQIRMDKHLEGINADEDHIKNDNDRLITFLEKNGYLNLYSSTSMLFQKSMSLILQAFGSNPESDINVLNQYSINSDFCSLRCQDDYRRYR